MTAAPSGTPLVVLLVEDNPRDAEIMATRLESDSCGPNAVPVRVLHTGSVAGARAALRDSSIDIIVLDLTLPDASGLETLRRVRAAAVAIPIIVLSGITDSGVALQALRAGAQDYVLKPPPDGATLYRILRYAYERHLLLRGLASALRASDLSALRWRLLAEVGRVLAATAEPAVAISEVAQLLVPDAADCVALILFADEEVPPLIAVSDVDSPRAPELRERLTHLLEITGPDAAARLALAVGEGVSSVEMGSTLQQALAVVGAASGTAVLVRVGARTCGFLLLAVRNGRSDDIADLEFAHSLADRVGDALERDRLLHQAQRASSARDRAMSIVSHDLRNPLGTVQICANALLDPEPASPDGVRHMAELIQRCAAWMQRIIQDLLDRASLDAGHLALECEPTDVAKIMFAAHLMFVPVAAELSIEFVVEPGSDLPNVDADPQRLLQVISNLLSNAMKFTPAGGRVRLSARLSGDDAFARHDGLAGDRSVRFSVTDTGRGIPPDEISHVFDWFWHSHHGRREGTGLGLAIAKGLIEAHRGRLYVESGFPPEQGCTFWFTIPAAGAQAPVSIAHGGLPS